MITLALLSFVISAILLGINAFAATAVGRVNFLSLGLFFMALGLAFSSHWPVIVR